MKKRWGLYSPGGEKVAVVDGLDEGLDLGLPNDGLLVHAPGHLPGGDVDTSHCTSTEEKEYKYLE